jgi:phage N-6-adenine-methyltransferase
MSQPSQGQDLQEGVYRTPMNLLTPINRRWPLTFDLAANVQNCAITRLHGSARHFTEVENALERDWAYVTKMAGGLCWLNPPYDDIGKWTAKAEAEAKRGWRGVMLIPSATGARWLVDYCLGAKIVFLIGRPVFEFINAMDHKNPAKRGQPNTDPYGKDLLLAVFDGTRGVEWWDWRD